MATDTIEQVKDEVKLPSMWTVILHNDDFTPIEFVIQLLGRIFNKSSEEAMEIALTVHRSERAKVGLYTREIAETKVNQATRLAREYEHPLLVTAEPA